MRKSDIYLTLSREQNIEILISLIEDWTLSFSHIMVRRSDVIILAPCECWYESNQTACVFCSNQYLSYITHKHTLSLSMFSYFAFSNETLWKFLMKSLEFYWIVFEHFRVKFSKKKIHFLFDVILIWNERGSHSYR